MGRKRKDDYVNQLRSFFPKEGDRKKGLINQLLISAMIEARSCERFRVLSDNISDQELSKFYHDLMASEANHYTMFLKFSRQYGDREEVDRKWNALLDFEGELIQTYGKKGEIHG